MGRAARVDCDIDRGARRGWMGMPRPTLAVAVADASDGHL